MSQQVNFSRRSYKKELLDGTGIPFPDIERNMLELDVINTWLGGHSISLQGLRRLGKGLHQLTLCEIGCGGSDNLRILSRWCGRHGIRTRIIGIDYNTECLAVAREKWTGPSAEWINSDYRTVNFHDDPPDIIFSSLFCHHFTDEELIAQLQWMDTNTRIGWFINDLHRHRLAWLSIRLLTAAFSSSYLVKNDAPLSVLRGFRRQEWERLMQKAETPGEIRWRWAFRWLLIRRKEYV